ncbi:DUF2235 domain-containing protein [Xanthomonas oryzae pv. oryzae]|uniref:T6SS phospholipase effector Tle1-like catalytic domain-containing protein n=1 Tax=Xanthomonas oryzae TaxID=347 RepID=UPI003D73AA9F
MQVSFAPLCPENPLQLSRAQQAEMMSAVLDRPQDSCCIDLRWGFFFDGTNNNFQRDQPKKAHSNVARLYDIFEADFEKPEFVGRYAAGVGTPFKDEVGDQGLGIQEKAGLAAGWGGEARICWALLKFLDNLHAYFERIDLGKALGQSDPATVRRMAQDITIPSMELRKIAGDETEMLRQISMMASLQSLTATALNPPNHRGRRAVLAERRAQLRQRVQTWQRAQPKPKLRSIRVSVFGFSRGAAEARVFCSWLKDACDGGGGELTLCGIPVQLDLLGIFDMVASVGLANSSRLWSGHGGYASEDDLQIAPYVRRCVHLVAAHEVRGSFPLDAAAGVNGEEVVYPGVHSDVGGGYEPGEQGKAFIGDSIDDSAKLSQIALCHMYREAMAAGVPLNLSASRLSKETKAAFKVDKGLIDAFNGYVAATGSIKASTTVALTQAHYALYLRWRRLRLDDTAPDGMAQQPFVTRARTYKAQDVTDLLQTNAELRQEWAALQQDEKDAAYSSEASVAHVLRSTLAPIAARDDIVALVWGEKMTQWREVKPAWNDLSPLDRRIVRLHDDYSHDSRAWFKPFGAASEEAWKRQYRQRMNRLEAQDNAWQQWNRDVQPVIDDAVRKAQKHPGSFQPTPEVRPMPPLVAGQDLKDLKQWRSNGGVIPTEQDGRESYGMFGFLRWRTIFVPEKSALAHSIDAVDETLEQIKQLPGKAKQAVGDAVESAVDSAVEAGKDFVGDQVRKLIPSGLPRM